ncbi:GAF domain-containing protein [Neorhizobium sp. BT27B]|uniref:GAF domain-containing protein n=1 Tax=Neorhizobium sp. BT27B TaxID=3142625 RepID=UPI003D29B1B4
MRTKASVPSATVVKYLTVIAVVASGKNHPGIYISVENTPFGYQQLKSVLPSASALPGSAFQNDNTGELLPMLELTSDLDQKPSVPFWNESDRLAAIERYTILDSGREEAFDDVAELAADILEAPIAVVNFIAADRQWFKAEVGIGTDTLPLDVSICRHAIMQPGVLVVPDLTQDHRFRGNPLIHIADGLRFYAGAVLETPDGIPLGTVCVLDRKSRPQGISERQKRALEVLAKQTMARLELRRSESTARAERARAEKHARRLSLVAKASPILLGADDQVEAVRTLFLLVADEFGLDVAFHYQCGDGALKLITAVGLTPEQEQAAARIEFGQTVCGIVAVNRAAMHVTEIQTSVVAHAVFLRVLGLDTYFSAPLLAGGDLLGTVSFGRRGKPFSPGELNALSAIAAQLATAIERGHAEEALRESEARQAFLLSLSDAMRVLKTPKEIAAVAAERLGERFNLSRVFYAEYFGSLMKIERDYTRGVDSIVGEHDLAAFGPELLRAYHEFPVVKVDDVQTDTRFNEDARAGLRARQVGAYLDVVLFEDENWVSLLALQSTFPRAWTTSEEGLFREVAERVRAASERARAEDSLRELNDTLERRVAETSAERDQIWRHSLDLLSVIDLTRATFDTVNPAWTAALGWTADEVVGRPFAQFAHPDDAEAIAHALELVRNGVSVTRFENRYRTRDGAWRWLSWVAVPESGKLYSITRDVTDDKARQTELEVAQDALRQSQKMEAMGLLTGGVAHDFNNLLTPIVGTLDLLQRRGVGSEREQRLIAGAVQSAERAKTLVQRLLAFARRQPLQSVPVDVAQLVAGMGELIASTTGPQIRVVVEVPEDLPPAKADPNQLEMALLNLAVNARDAMGENGGKLRISTRVENVLSGHRTNLPAGDYICVSVADTGAGMDEATLARAIEPFFSTKGVGKGTGLGLSMVHGLASQLGGALTIQSCLGLGTNVELWLPLSAATPETADTVADLLEVPHTCGTALLVDDEDLVRMSTADMLGDLGYAVIEVASGEEALHLIKSGTHFDLLVTDHLMPGISGTDLAREVRSVKPDAPVILVSGYADNEGVDPDIPRLTKPFRIDELATMLAQLATTI